MSILIVGSNGVVGRDLLRLLNNDNNDYSLTLVNRDMVIQEYKGERIMSVSLENVKNKSFDYVFNCADESISNEIIKNISFNYYIDNSSNLRRDERVPLVIPELNFRRDKIIANPNCTSIILCLFLSSLNRLKINKINVSTYQALSGGGKKKIEKLLKEEKECNITENNLSGRIREKQIAYNFYPHESKKLENGFNGEEEKVMYETNRIMGYNVFVTCIRVPVIRCHGESVTIIFDKEYSKEEIIESIKSVGYLNYDEDIDCVSNEYSNKVSVGHIRHNPLNKKEWNFFIVGDQITRGASYNAYGIFNNIVKTKVQ